MKAQIQKSNSFSLPHLSVLAIFCLLSLTACDKGGGSFSLLPDSNSFQQATSSTNNKIDILFVVDNSASMAPLQTNLNNNFHSFINNFVTKGYDFQLGVTTSDAYRSMSQFGGPASAAYLRDGVGSVHSGYPIITQSTPDIEGVFVTNANQGDNGNADERVFSSFKATLQSSHNNGFHRPDAFLAIVILSDEDDFSNPNRAVGANPDHSYSQTGLETVASYISFLDQYTGTVDVNNRPYNISAITVLDNTCLNSHKKNAPTSIVGQRYMQIVNATDGVLGSICDTSFADSLTLIESKIIELSTQFPLSRVPDVSTIQVHVNGAVIIESSTNGWTYNSTANSIVFHGSAVPPQGSQINVDFQPLSAQN
jgi:hypothetical protein